MSKIERSRTVEHHHVPHRKRQSQILILDHRRRRGSHGEFGISIGELVDTFHRRGGGGGGEPGLDMHEHRAAARANAIMVKVTEGTFSRGRGVVYTWQPAADVSSTTRRPCCRIQSKGPSRDVCGVPTDQAGVRLVRTGYRTRLQTPARTLRRLQRVGHGKSSSWSVRPAAPSARAKAVAVTITPRRPGTRTSEQRDVGVNLRG